MTASTAGCRGLAPTATARSSGAAAATGPESVAAAGPRSATGLERAADQFDAIVIGSGIGGMTAASLLAQLRGMRVLVLERHFALGGFTHAFTRSGYRWDVGVHYVGQMAPGQHARQLMDLATGGEVGWEPMPRAFDVFHYPGLTLSQPAGAANFLAELQQTFPQQAGRFAGYLHDVRQVARWLGMETMRWSMPRSLRAAAGVALARPRRLALLTTQEYLRQQFTDPRVAAVLASQWGDYGLPPARSAFAAHATIVAHYLEGAWFPTGGADTVTAAMRRIVEDAGGSCRVNHTVTEIVLEKGRAVGVRAAVKRGRGERAEFRAPVVISDAGARLTYHHLLPAGAAPRLQHALTAAESGMGNVGVYLGLKRSPQSLGFDGENHWFFDSFDHDRLSANTDSILQGRPGSGYLSFPSLKDSTATRHTAEILAFVEPEAFSGWSDTRWQRRGAEYSALKERISQGLVSLVDRHYPGFADLVDVCEVSTPLTVQGFTGYPSGGFADLAATPERFRQQLVPARSPVSGLWSTGADVCSLGIVGALMGGVVAAAAVLGPAGIVRVMRAAARQVSAAPDATPVPATAR